MKSCISTYSFERLYQDGGFTRFNAIDKTKEYGCHALFQHFPGLIGVEMDFDQLIVADRQQAVSLEMLSEIFADLIPRCEVLVVRQHELW